MPSPVRESPHQRRPSRIAAAVLGLATLAACLAMPAARGQTLARSGPPDSVVARLMAWRMTSDGPVPLSALARFNWDTFGVVTQAAGEAMANCGQAGFLPCDADLQPARGAPVQVLVFRLGTQRVYQERITARSAEFAEPLPADVPRSLATLVGCPGYRGQVLWCLRGSARGRLPDPFLDGG
ncbi:hypothetical protein P3W85_17910 [Cupriavidus basilensis]|uniref:Uncharacterized protein n=1 Tax=Cupriavidus basilensis TaxID=68895 RepID=A0ABT6AQC5_9BURK|nr:hypothetical protein [Cupriavidus basilensis]MDF3834817.1 hypothetical protein [Cupriavidus basilensis]